MSQHSQEQFEQSLQSAVKASLQSTRAGEALRGRLLEALKAGAELPPSGLAEDELARFESATARAVAHSQDAAPDSALVARVEGAVGREAGRDLRSERSLHLGDEDCSKGRYLQGLRDSVRDCQQAIVAPPECRRRVEEAVKEAARGASPATAAPSRSKVVSLPSSSRWKRAAVAAASLAATVALVFGTFLGGAEKALAESVRKDHKRCCSTLKKEGAKHCAPYNSSSFGPLPSTRIAEGWNLVASQMCHAPGGGPMVHNVYLKDGKTISVHFLPSASVADAASVEAPARELAGDQFPVLAWEKDGWTITACSADLDAKELASAVGCRKRKA